MNVDVEVVVERDWLTRRCRNNCGDGRSCGGGGIINVELVLAG